MKLSIGERDLEFLPIELEFHQTGLVNLFAKKNNKTLAQTLTHPRYAHLCSEAMERYATSLNEKLGDFLDGLKMRQDVFYRKFLNPYGDMTYCRFSMNTPLSARARGLYVFVAGDCGQVKYVGKTIDSFTRRINQGYGQIHPKNCYLDGQATNCHLNSLIARSTDRVGLEVCPLRDVSEIARLEELLIQRLQPEWNIALNLKTSSPAAPRWQL
jgi:hypothetical protein